MSDADIGGSPICGPLTGPGFRDVDRSGVDDKLVGLLDMFARHPDIVAARQTGTRMLDPRPGGRYLDVGSGVGEATAALADLVVPGGVAVGLDFSKQMVDEAIARHGDRDGALVFEHGSALELPFEDATFDGARSERTFQHLDDPDRALAEMIRVVRPGGRIVVIDSDWHTAMLDLDDLGIVATIMATMNERTASPTVGRRLFRMFHLAGLEHVDVAPAPVLFRADREQNEVVGFPTTGILTAREAGRLTEHDATRALEQVKAAAENGYGLFGVMMMVVVGTKPA